MMKVLKPLVNGIRCEKMVRTVSGYRKVISNENNMLMRKIHTSHKVGRARGGVERVPKARKQRKNRLSDDSCGQPLTADIVRTNNNKNDHGQAMVN